MPETALTGAPPVGRVRRRRPLATFITVLCTFLLVLLPGSLTATATANPPDDHPARLKVLTRNIYLGADLRPVLAATDASSLFAAVNRVFTQVQATNFPERAEALADEIADSDPHLVGLQEVRLWRSQTPADFSPTPNATVVEYDFLQILLDALAARGKHYAAVATITSSDREIPRSTPGGGLQDIRSTDRDVILARTDLPAKKFSVANPQQALFDARLTIPHPVLGNIVFPHGWVAVDATVGGRTTRVVSTHLEAIGPAVQVQQGEELLDGPLDTERPTVLLGDLNSAAGGVGAVPGSSDTPTYANFLADGFKDVWVATHRKNPGFTCCQAPDLRNPTSTLSQRIDYVLFRNGFKALKAERVGEEQADRTPSGLWPSDHAGVLATLKLPRR
ncbi:endonuclease/exonuclease/phosphatase family protein [Streptomyces bambusae]|uniref:Endonuclease n=1 Tax=Streptomyces bambusae TaxID=1550616 RepID=A0ABS6Z9I7_9ACTN|nr:endonuclease/exonuclease/phosphatase family protein [Streptomyces bambusae]MBW5484407.1 endonuclease [Streptomyces bambusae]